MLDNKDIKKLTEVFATKDEVRAIKKDTEALRESVQAVLSAVDSIAKSIGELKLEYAAISTNIDRHEKWIKQIADKVGVSLEY